jgi:predicted DNA-binding transcriptional regulator AlpA
VIQNFWNGHVVETRLSTLLPTSEAIMQRKNSTSRRWRRKALADYWGVSDRTVDRMAKDGRLGPPKYIGRRTPTWSDEQREAAEHSQPEQTAA